MGRALRLARIALAAEGIRLRQLLRLRLRQGALIAAALCFVLFALALGHAAALLWLAPRLGGIGAALALAGADLVMALALLLAARGDGRLGAEARAVRQAALAELRAEWPRVSLHAVIRRWSQPK